MQSSRYLVRPPASRFQVQNGRISDAAATQLCCVFPEFMSLPSLSPLRARSHPSPSNLPPLSLSLSRIIGAANLTLWSGTLSPYLPFSLSPSLSLSLSPLPLSTSSSLYSSLNQNRREREKDIKANLAPKVRKQQNNGARSGFR